MLGHLSLEEENAVVPALIGQGDIDGDVSAILAPVASVLDIAQLEPQRLRSVSIAIPAARQQIMRISPFVVP